MSVRHPIISVTGSSGAGTTSVKRTFERIFKREGIRAAFIEGDSFHRYDRAEMKRVMAEEAARGNNHFSHFGPDANLLEDLERLFREFGESGTGRLRHYVHDEEEEKLYGTPPGTFSRTPWPTPTRGSRGAWGGFSTGSTPSTSTSGPASSSWASISTASGLLAGGRKTGLPSSGPLAGSTTSPPSSTTAAGNR